jgi:hypothetical protein
MKFKSQLPRVTPSVGVLVSSPVHVTLRVEAAYASTIMSKTSTKMQTNVRRLGIATYPNGRYDMRDFSGTGVVAAMLLERTVKLKPLAASVGSKAISLMRAEIKLSA